MDRYIIARESTISRPIWDRHRFVCYKDGGKVGYLLVFIGKRRAIGSYVKMVNYRSALVKEVMIKDSERGNGIASVILASLMSYLERESDGKGYTFYVKSWIPFTKDAWCWRKRYFPHFKSIIIGSGEQKRLKSQIEQKYGGNKSLSYHFN
ncbi:MAG: hypothetical protein ABH829_01195 [archaeon]